VYVTPVRIVGTNILVKCSSVVVENCALMERRFRLQNLLNKSIGLASLKS
jgi:hypothetical protein